MPDRRMVSRNFLKSSIAWKAGEIGEQPEEGLCAMAVFLALILVADDFGNGRYIPQMILIEALGSQPKVLDKYSGSDVKRWIEAFQSEGAVRIYEVDGQDYFSLTGWEHYQKGNWRPNESHIPKPPIPPKEKRKEGNRIERKSTQRTSKVPDKYPESIEKVNPDNQALLQLARLYFPDTKKMPDDLLAVQADALDKLCRIDGYPETEIRDIINWLTTGQDRDAEFWRGVVGSFPRLRETKDGVKCAKWVNLRKAWVRNGGNETVNITRDRHRPDETIDSFLAARGVSDA